LVSGGLQERAAVASPKEGSKLVPTLVVTCTVLIFGPGRQVALLLFAVLPPMVLLRVAAILWPSIGALQVALVWPLVTR
jgi:hypothetical protein